MDEELAKKMQQGAAQLGVDLGENEVKLYFRYLDLLIEWNSKFNLTAITEPSEVITKHFLDSIAMIPYLNEAGLKLQSEFSLLDVGSGAGFPGVPVKIALPWIRVVLLDSLNKRINFLNHLAGELKLSQVRCIHGRAEDLGHQGDFREQFDVVTSRAVAKLSVLAEFCMPFVKVGGVFVAYKGPKSTQEIEDARTALEILGGQVVKHVAFKIPGLEDERSLVFVSKTKPTPQKYARKSGLPEKKPL